MQIELREKAVRITGYVNAVERDSRVLPPIMAPNAPGAFVERIRAGVFERALRRGKPIELRFNHGRSFGCTGKELKLREDAVGLFADALVTDPEVVQAARENRLTGWSFGMHAEKDAWDVLPEAPGHRRTLEELQLDEVSVLTVTPAYLATTVELRGDNQSVLEVRSTEDAPEVNPEAEISLYRAKLNLIKIGGTYGKVEP